MRGAFLGLTAACVLMAACASADAAMRVARVTGNGVNMRSEPSTSAGRISGLSNGDFLLVMEERRGDKHPWYGVMAEGAVEGWVYGHHVRFLTEEDRDRSYDMDVYEQFEAFHMAVLDQLPHNHEGAKERFGKPASEEHIPIPSDHDPSSIVDYYTLNYPGFELIYFESDGGSGLLGIDLPAPGLTLGKRVKIGADVSDVVLEAGAPIFCEESTLIWTDFSGYTEFYVSLDGRSVTKIKLLTWLD